MLEMFILAIYFSIGPIVGLVGSLLGLSVQRQIMEDVGVKSLPWNQTQRDLLIAKRCNYIWRWNKIDTYNLVVFLIGAVGLVISVVLEGLQISEPRQVLFWNDFPLVFPILLLSLILVIISSIMIIVRLLYLMRLYRLLQLGEEVEEGMNQTPMNQNPKPGSNIYIILTSVLAMFYAFSSVFVIKAFGLPVFGVITVVFVVLTVFLSIKGALEHKKKKGE
ncbi:hypothetical protein [Risungbinella massiliensis]|uniref:hypothetical protein n=1 Tax=Risungbinella massiliensis TaxID=1329796 RepID=UPI0005CC8E17|nr:hypothetical protein [Risungbinella massiliensis]